MDEDQVAGDPVDDDNSDDNSIEAISWQDSLLSLSVGSRKVLEKS